MPSLLTVLRLAGWGSVAAVFAAAIACGLRRWHFGARVARTVALAGPVLVGTSVLVILVSPLGAQGPDPSMKATLLSQGISEVINCAALLLVAAAAAAGIWGLARWRLRVGRKSAVM